MFPQYLTKIFQFWHTPFPLLFDIDMLWNFNFITYMPFWLVSRPTTDFFTILKHPIFIISISVCIMKCQFVFFRWKRSKFFLVFHIEKILNWQLKKLKFVKNVIFHISQERVFCFPFITFNMPLVQYKVPIWKKLVTKKLY